jgi:UDP-GlcNAc:undecaprenyl-phosphate GlcNAc-1-phosphate transferase
VSIWLYICGFVVALFGSLVCTAALIRISNRWGLFIDRPAERRLHTRAVPRCGGVAVYSGFLVAVGLLFFSDHFKLMNLQLRGEQLTLFLQVGGWLLMVGLLDDAGGLRWYTKLLAQIAAAVVMCVGGVSVESIGGFRLDPTLNLVFTVGWFLVFINAMNLIDGLDGLAGGLAIFGAIGLALLSLFLRSPGDTVLIISFVGACAGFLYFNFHPARIFLGDSGSMFLGFALATFGLAIGAKTSAVTAIVAPLVAIGVPFFDALLAVWRRSARALLGRIVGSGNVVSIAHADMEHLHHRLVKLGLSQRRVALTLYGASVSLVVVGLMTVLFHEQAGAILLLAFIAGAYVIVRHLCHTELWDSGALVAAGFRRPKGAVIATVVLPLVDVVTLAAALLFADFLFAAEAKMSLIKAEFFRHASVWIGIPFVGLVLTRTYSRVWSRARISEFVLLGGAFLASCAVAFGVVALEGPASLRGAFVHGLVFSGVACFFLLGVRAIPRAFTDMLTFIRGGDEGRSAERLLLYGAGARCQLYMRRRLEAIIDRASSGEIVGLVDDDPNLRKRLVLGFEVCGIGQEIASLIERFGVTQVVLLCTLPAGAFAALTELCRAKRVGLVVWDVGERVILESESPRGATAPPAVVVETLASPRRVEV